MRINKFLALNLKISRRESDRLIKNKKIKINGKFAILGQIVEENDVLIYKNEVINPISKHQYYKFYKPINYVSSHKSQGNSKTIYEIVKNKIEYKVSGEAFYTKPNKEIYMVKKIVKKITGNSAKLNCRGGTSDSRFLGSIPRLELGLKNNTIHMVDERTSISDLKKLTKIYYNILENYF